jgi:hypothetical protein
MRKGRINKPSNHCNVDAVNKSSFVGQVTLYKRQGWIRESKSSKNMRLFPMQSDKSCTHRNIFLFCHCIGKESMAMRSMWWCVNNDYKSKNQTWVCFETYLLLYNNITFCKVQIHKNYCLYKTCQKYKKCIFDILHLWFKSVFYIFICKTFSYFKGKLIWMKNCACIYNPTFFKNSFRSAIKQTCIHVFSY